MLESFSGQVCRFLRAPPALSFYVSFFFALERPLCVRALHSFSPFEIEVRAGFVLLFSLVRSAPPFILQPSGSWYAEHVRQEL